MDAPDAVIQTPISEPASGLEQPVDRLEQSVSQLAAGDPPGTVSGESIAAIERSVHELCERYAERLPFHGWHHIRFVRDKAVSFARTNGSDAAVVEAAALVHDVNYLVRRNSIAAAGRSLRLDILAEAGVDEEVALWIDAIVDEAEMRTRHRDISLEAQALSDADTLYKALPVTPVVLAHRYLRENGISLRELAHKIVGEQSEAYDEGYYFYNAAAEATYSRWAQANIQLWQCIKEAVDDPSVEELLRLIEPPATGEAPATDEQTTVARGVSLEG